MSRTDNDQVLEDYMEEVRRDKIMKGEISLLGVMQVSEWVVVKHISTELTAVKRSTCDLRWLCTSTSLFHKGETAVPFASVRLVTDVGHVCMQPMSRSVISMPTSRRVTGFCAIVGLELRCAQFRVHHVYLGIALLKYKLHKRLCFV